MPFISKHNQNQSLLIFVLFICFVFLGCDSMRSTKVLRVSHGLSDNHPVHQALIAMNDHLQSISGGKLKLKIYPTGQLGAERESLELVQLGGLDMAKVSAATMENFVPEFKVFNLPYLFENKEHRLFVFSGETGRKLLDRTDAYRLKSLCFYEAGARSFYTIDRPILTPSDLKGLKIRVMKSRTAVDMMEALGGSATPISFGELYSALQQRIVDGAENNLASFYTTRHYELCKHFTFDEHSCVPDILVVGTSTWEKLSEQEKNWLMIAAKQSSVHEQKLWDDFEEEAMIETKKQGVTFYRTDRKEFKNLTQSLYTKELLGELTEWVDLIQCVNYTKKKSSAIVEFPTKSGQK